jgi:hypothetical protein
MKTNNLIRFAQSLVLLPVMTMSFSGIPSIKVPQDGLVKKVNIIADGILAPNQASVSEADLISSQILKAKADAIDTYFSEHDMPLAGTGMKMVQEADLNGLDWRLLPAIAVRESTGGKNPCSKAKNNFFGWGSCKVGFDSTDEAIEVLAKNLAGKNPNTAQHYSSKDVKEILNAYNPPSIVPKYAKQVMAIMNAIGDEDIILPTPALASTTTS